MEPRQRRFLVAGSVNAELARQGWSHERLAMSIRMPVSELTRKLQGQQSIDIDELDAIATALGVTVDSLLESQSARGDSSRKNGDLGS